MAALPLHATGISKSFGKTQVLDNIELTVESGECVALVGRNGAGKSTLMGCLVGTVIPDAGGVSIAGHSLADKPIQARKALRYLAQEVEVPVALTGREVLEFYADVFGDRSQLEAAVELANIGPSIDHLATTYSVGMKKRVVFAGLTAGHADLYVLDEPLAGVDGETRVRLRDFLAAQLERGAGVLVAAHDQDHADLDALNARRFALS